MVFLKRTKENGKTCSMKGYITCLLRKKLRWTWTALRRPTFPGKWDLGAFHIICRCTGEHGKGTNYSNGVQKEDANLVGYKMCNRHLMTRVTFLGGSSITRVSKKEALAMRENCPNTELFPVRISLYSDHK